jgi:BirA family biotin operon repressor/biotin-[acetyl-CoA-carboxylase] ligase
MDSPPIPIEPRNDPFQHALSNTSRIVLKRLLHFSELSSTNDYLKEKGTIGEREGLIILADSQTTGKGRLNREWFSPKGGLYFSVLLRPMTLNLTKTPLITLTAGVAVAHVLHTALGLTPHLKWPNDVLLDTKKVAGILVESTFIGDDIEYSVVGVGVNANTPLTEFPSELQQTTTTLQQWLQRPVNLPRLFGYLIGQLEFWYLRLRDQGSKAILAQYRRICATLGSHTTVDIGDQTLTGLAKDIGPDGSLILQTKAGRRVVSFGDVVSSTPASQIDKR